MARSCCSACRASQGQLSSRSRSKRLGWFSCKGALLLSRLACNGRNAVEESVCDDSSVKQVLYGTQRGSGLHRKSLSRPSYRDKVCPVGGDHRFTAIGQDQDEIQSPSAMHRPKKLKRPSLKRMTRADDHDSLGKVLMMGSVS